MVTVYRTLGLLCELGIARSLNLGDGPRYELAGDHHHHLVCDFCGDVSEFVECPLDLERVSLGGSGFEVRSHSVEIYGRCAACGGPGQ